MKKKGKQASSLLHSTAIVSLMTLLSRLVGFARDVVLASVFGAGASFDAFVVAFKLPNFMRRLFAEGAFSQAFVPVLSEYRSEREHSEVQDFLNHIAAMLGLSLTLLVIVVEIAAPLIIMVFAPGFLNDPERYHQATHLLHITFPYLLLIALTAFSGAILNTYGRFALPAFTPVMLNMAMITVAWFWAPHTAVPIYTLAWGVILGGLAQLLVQLPLLARLNLLPRPQLQLRDLGVSRVLKLMIPALFGVSVAQISLLMDNFFASFLPAGSISWLYYSDRLIYLPQGVIGVALATVVLPSLSRYHAQQSQQRYVSTLDWALRVALLIGLPAAVGLFTLATPILVTLIYRGAFTDFDVMMTAKSLRAFALGLPAFMWVKILASAFYSKHDIRTPVKIAAIAVLLNIVLDGVLIYPMAHAGLALATAATSVFNAVCLLYALQRRQLFRLLTSIWGFLLLRLLIANAVMAALIICLSGNLQTWLGWSLWPRIWHLGVIIVIAMVVYVVSLLLLGLRKQDFRPACKA